MNEESLETSYANFLIALAKYHGHLKTKSRELKERAESLIAEGNHGAAGNASLQSTLYWEHSKSMLWLLHRRSEVMRDILGVDEPEEAAYLHFAPDSGDDSLKIVDVVPVNYLGVTRAARERLKARISSMFNSCESPPCGGAMA